MPVTSTMSPACADSTGTRSMPANAKICVTRALGATCAFGERAVEHGDFLPCRETSAADPSDAKTPDIARVVERGDLELQRLVRVADRRRHVRENRFEQRPHVGALRARRALSRR